MKLKKHVITTASITLVVESAGKSKTHTIKNTDDRFSVLKKMLKDGQHAAAIELLDTSGKIEKLTEGAIRRGDDGELYIEDDQMPPALADKIRMVAASDYDPTPFVKFWQRLKQNPSENSRKQFYKFVQNCDCNITSEGKVILYKGVSKDLRSRHAATHVCRDGRRIDLLHTPGVELSIPREDAADNPNVACSTGLHCAPWNYVSNFYSDCGAIVELMVDPKDVVSVPNDGNGHKMRVCAYKVLRKMGQGDTPLKDVLAKMKRKETDGAKEIRSKAKNLKKAAVQAESGRLILPPDILLAVNFEPRSKLSLLATGGTVVIGTEGSKALVTLLGKARKKSEQAISKDVKPSIRGSLEIPNVVLRSMHPDGGIYTEYTCSVIAGNMLRVSPARGATLEKGSHLLVESKKKSAEGKAKKKLETKVAKKVAKKAAKKVAKKAAKKVAKKK